MSTRPGPKGAAAYTVISQSRLNQAQGAHAAVPMFRRPGPEPELGLALLKE